MTPPPPVRPDDGEAPTTPAPRGGSGSGSAPWPIIDSERPTGVGEFAAGPDAPTGAAGSVVGPDTPTGVAGRSAAPDAPTGGAVPRSAAPDAPTGTGGSRGLRDGGPLTVGHDFGARYHIIRLLGAGGMGAVYQAWDKVLEVAVAVKVIRPPDADDAEAAQALERRFKRELLLARQVTHKHVVRIHDLGEIDGTTYITMPYVHGSNLASLLKKEGRIAPDRAVAITRQIASGLAAAHEAGVIHRDLKPANIMIEAEGDALIMDFGIARSTAGGAGLSMTAGGAIVGTIEYMAPEQARGATVDHRADVYSLGLILNDMLLGRRQGGESTAVAELMARMQQPPSSVRSVDPTLPEWLDRIVTRCLNPDPAQRYQHIGELVLELGAEESDSPRSSAGTAARVLPLPAGPAKQRRPLALFLGAVLLLGLGLTGWLLRDRIGFGAGTTVAPASGPTVSLAVLPFRNASGDPTLDSLGASLSQVLNAEFGQSSRVRAVPGDRLHQVLHDLRLEPNATLQQAEIEQVANFANARRVLWGVYSRLGNAIRIDATLQDLDRQVSVPLSAMAPNDASLLAAISSLAEAVRQELGRESADVLADLKATSWKPSTSSFEALRLYSEGVALTEQGSHQEALKRFEAATKQDGNFALAFSALARAHAALGYDNEAVQASRRAMGLATSLPPQEKYLIAANHYQIGNDSEKAIEAYENLVKASPNSPTIQFELGGLYEQTGSLDKARERFASVVTLDPKFVQGLLALGRVEIKRGRPQDALAHLNNALSLSVQLKNDESRANVLQAIGIAYKLLDRPDDALQHYQQSLEIKRRLGNKRGMAGSLGEIAQIQERLGKPREAEASYQAALALQREIDDKSGKSISLINLAVLYNETLGRPDDALPLLREALQLRRDAGNASGEALVMNNIGNVYLAKGEFSEAQTYFGMALQIREKTNVPGELADTLHNLGETLGKMGRYDQALTHYHRALEYRRTAGDKRGAAIESSGIGAIFEMQGRYGAAVKSKADALQAYRETNQRDPWLVELLAGYGQSLTLAGRMDEAVKPLDEAIALARELQNPSLIAQVTRYQADRLNERGDPAAAATAAAQAIEAATKAADRNLLLLAQVTAAAATAPPTRALAARFATLALDADKRGLIPVAVEASVRRAEALLAVGDRAAARQEADRTLARAETLGFRMAQARAHAVRAAIMLAERDAEARREYGLVLRLLNEMRAEDGSQQLLERAGLKERHAEATRESKGG